MKQQYNGAHLISEFAERGIGDSLLLEADGDEVRPRFGHVLEMLGDGTRPVSIERQRSIGQILATRLGHQRIRQNRLQARVNYSEQFAARALAGLETACSRKNTSWLRNCSHNDKSDPTSTAANKPRR